MRHDCIKAVQNIMSSDAENSSSDGGNSVREGLKSTKMSNIQPTFCLNGFADGEGEASKIRNNVAAEMTVPRKVVNL